MEQFEFIPYMQNIAEKLKDIRHSDLNPSFFKISGIAGLEQYLAEMPEAQFPALMAVENPEGRISDNHGDNFTDTPSFEFYICMDYTHGVSEERYAAKQSCKAIGKKILSKMLRDSRKRLHGLDFMQFNDIPYFPVGPFGDQVIAVYFRFDINQGAGMVYNPDDWNE